MNAFAPIRDLPSNVDLEASVIGSMMKDRGNLASALERCTPDDFHHSPYPMLFEAMHKLHSDGRDVNPIAVGSNIDVTVLEDVGGQEFLFSLMLAAETGSNLSNLRSLIDLRLRRQLTLAAMDCLEASNGFAPLLQSAKPVLEVADRIAHEQNKRSDLPIDKASLEMLSELEAALNGQKIEMATTGLKALDGAIGGLQGGDMIIYAGRPGMGKSALLMTSALRTAMEGRPVLFFSLEMTQKRLLQRMGCDLDYDSDPRFPLSYSRFRNGNATHDDVGRLAMALRKAPKNLHIIENGSLSIQEIAAMSRAFAARNDDKMGAIFIDYLQKVSAGDRYRGNRVQEVTEISGSSKALAMSLKWPVVLGAQLNRGVESREEKRPTLTDLRESGAIKQDADAVIGLYRPAYYKDKEKPAEGERDPGYAAWKIEYDAIRTRLDLHVLKNRNGAEWSGDVKCEMAASAIRDRV